MTDQAARERFKAAAEKVIRAAARNIADRGVGGPESALHVGANRTRPGLLDQLADAAESAYDGPQPRRGGKGAGE